MALSKKVLFLALQVLVAACFANVGAETQDSSDLSILAVGLSGSGCSGTIEKLLHNKVKKNKIPSSVVEYRIPIDLPNKEGEVLRLAVSSGLVNGKTEEEDAATLSSLREYLESPKGLNGTTPSVVMVFARFDDTQASQIDSDFIYMLRKLNSLKRLLFSRNSQSNAIFHFNFLMKRSESETSNPNSTIEYFRNIINGNGGFSAPIRITIGENRPADYNLPVQGHSAVLPNGQLYPQNLIDEISTSLQSQHLLAESDTFRAAIPKIETIDSSKIESNVFYSNRYLDSYKKIVNAIQVLRDLPNNS